MNKVSTFDNNTINELKIFPTNYYYKIYISPFHLHFKSPNRKVIETKKSAWKY